MKKYLILLPVLLLIVIGLTLSPKISFIKPDGSTDCYIRMVTYNADTVKFGIISDVFTLESSKGSITINDTIKGAPIWDGDLEVNGTITPENTVHAFMRFGDSSSTYNFTQNVVDTITNTGDSLFNKGSSTSEFDDVTYEKDGFKLQKDGDYEGGFFADIDGSNNDVWFFLVYHNSTLINKRRLKFSAQVAEGGKYVPFYVRNGQVDDVIWFGMVNTANSNDPVFVDGYADIYFKHK